MPTVRPRPRDAVNLRWLSDTFAGAANDDFTRGWSDEPLFRNKDEARHAWGAARRIIWAETPRNKIPRAAAVFDGLQLTSHDALSRAWSHTVFPLALVLAAGDADRAALAAFAATPAANDIRDYLVVFGRRLDDVETWAREYAAASPGHHSTPHPSGRGSHALYGAV